MSRLLDAGLEQLTVMVYRMGEVAEKAVDMSIRGFINGKDATAAVRELSDILTTMSLEVENKAFELIVKYQPVASDLRIINSYMKIAYDFERYGRYAWDISFTHKKLTGLDKCMSPSDLIQKLVETVCEMVSKSVQALKQNDGEMAKSLAKIEKEADKLYFAYLDQLVETTKQNKRVMCNLLVSLFLERIADHTTYVAEAIVYIATGEKISLR
ncbi:MAG TPA: phosphate signaling complex protein PhoU [Candidatus Bathyarchaeia archaeon]|jgi:phosphate transport system protein|nr:phosphate signaling complex protein PhoU [Candidatus Bathyarchaeia archaeon]